MTDEPKRRGRPPKAISGSDEHQSDEWRHPPFQGHTEEQETVVVLGNPTVTGESFLPETTAISYADSLEAPDLPHGFQPIESAPKDARIVVSGTGEDQTVVFWRIRRVVDKKNLRYIKYGAWTDLFRRIDITFKPKYWRPYKDTDYVLMMRAK